MDNYHKLVETIKLVASAPNIQLSAIPEQACRPDEIAFCLEEIMPLLKDFTKKQIITTTVSSKIEEINQTILSFEKQDWTEMALTCSPKWENVRATAVSILELLGEKAVAPDLFWISDIF
jgi:hypothetical protein